MGLTIVETIALFDANWHGHHPTYLKLITKVLLDSDYKVWLLCQRPAEVEQWVKQNTDEKKLKYLKTYKISRMLPKNYITWWVWGLQNWINASNYIKTLEKQNGYKPDIVLFLKVDDFTKGLLTAHWIDTIFPYAWSGIYIFLKFQLKIKLPFIQKSIYPLFLAFSAKNCKSIGILQEDCASKFQSIINKPVVVLPDVTDGSQPSQNDLVQTILQKARGRKIIGLIGGQDKRKGSFTLLEIAKRCKDKDWFFLFAGKMNYHRSDRELEQLKRVIGNEKHWENCFFHFNRIPDECDFNGVFDLCDVIFAVYPDFQHSSNIITKAALFRKPIIVASEKLMAKRVEEFNIGTSCKQGDIEDCIKKIGMLLEDKLPDPMYEEYYNNHSITNLEIQLKSIIDLSLEKK